MILEKPEISQIFSVQLRKIQSGSILESLISQIGNCVVLAEPKLRQKPLHVIQGYSVLLPKKGVECVQKPYYFI